jgi:hypothetical protein
MYSHGGDTSGIAAQESRPMEVGAAAKPSAQQQPPLSPPRPPLTWKSYCCCCCCTLFPAVVFPFMLIGAWTAASQGSGDTATVASIQRLGAVDPLAVCNDGSEGVYHWAPATDDAKARRWLVWLPGGDFCESPEVCADRQKDMPQLMTSASVPDETKLGGLMASDAPTFGGANIASVYYCSSDQHTGDRVASEETYGLHFRGQRIVKAVLKDLVGSKGLRSGDQLTLAGCSAGSNGAEQLCDFVPGWVPEGVAVSCIFDSPLSAIDVPALSDAMAPRVPKGKSQLITVSGEVGNPDRYANTVFLSHLYIKTIFLPRQARDKHSENSITRPFPLRPSTVELWNTTAVLSPACVASRATKDDLWECNWAQFTLQFHTVPYFMNANRFDAYSASMAVGAGGMAEKRLL